MTAIRPLTTLGFFTTLLAPKRLLPFVLVVVLVVAGVFALSLRSGLAQLDRTASVRIVQTSDRLLGQLESFRELVNFLVAHPTVLAAGADLDDFLLDVALRSGADDVYITDAQGIVQASSNARTSASYVGEVFFDRPDIVSARSGVLGFHYAFNPTDTSRDFFYARGILDENSKPIGYAVVKVDVAGLEFEWRIDEDPVAILDRERVVFVTNRPSLILQQLDPDPDSARADGPTAFYKVQNFRLFGSPVWRMPAAQVVPQLALVRAQPIPQINMQTYVFMDVRGVLATAILQASLAVALMCLLGLAFGVLAQRRNILGQANQQLEARVEDRTVQLRAAQNALVQASKLSALGQMSAGISHELNQPLATIRNYADNAQKLLTLGRTDETAQNLEEISTQITRMDRIIRHLRGFARNQTEAYDAVDLFPTVQAALGHVAARLEGVHVTMEVPEEVWVHAGQVRLEQVLGNLLNNALDAMEGQARAKALSLTLSQEDDMTVLYVLDSGQGLADPDRVFEPFYTTKEVGASKGLGLGLSISYGIIGSFGGALSARNTAQGAEFRIALRSAEVLL